MNVLAWGDASLAKLESYSPLAPWGDNVLYITAPSAPKVLIIISGNLELFGLSQGIKYVYMYIGE